MDVNPFESPQSPLRQTKLIPEEGLACTFELSPQIFEQVHWKRNSSFYIFIRAVSLVMGLGILVMMIAGQTRAGTPAVLKILVGGIALSLTLYGLFCPQFLKLINRWYYQRLAQLNGQCRLALTREEIQFRSNTGQQIAAWNEITTWRYRRDVLFVSPAGSPSFFIPMDRLTANVRDCLETLLPR